jgi:uncharacterized damage-inducible protein DinB
VWASAELARAGFDPITRPEDAIDWDTLREKFLGSRDRCLAAIGALSDDALATMSPDPFGHVTSLAAQLNLFAFHQTYHIGQLGMARRVGGLAGAIKAPNQTQHA